MTEARANRRWGPKLRGKSRMTPSTDAEICVRHDWTRAEVEALFDLPLPELTFRAMAVHRAVFDPVEVQLSELLSVKTGGCAEDCGYCSQSVHFDTGLKASRLMAAETVIAEASRARARGAQRFCMGAAWRELKDRDLPELARMIAGVKALGLETCATLGMLTPEQALALRGAGLDYYNHNLDTAPEDYARIVSTRAYDERLDTLAHVRDAGINVCCGGIVGMGETRSRSRRLAAGPGQSARAPAVPADQRPRSDQGHTAWRQCAHRRARVRAHDRCRPHRLPARNGAPGRRPAGDEPRAAGHVPHGRRQLDLHRREIVDHAAARRRQGSRFACGPRHAANGRRFVGRVGCATGSGTVIWRGIRPGQRPGHDPPTAIMVVAVRLRNGRFDRSFCMDGRSVGAGR